ncbi:LysE family translocator [Capnocytophaga sp. HP1101]
MNVEIVLSFLMASVILSIMPGPDNLFVLTESITKGKREGTLIAIGLSLGVLVHTVATAFAVIKYVGAAYLFYLAFKAYKEKKLEMHLTEGTTSQPKSAGYLVRKGFLMNVLNPKVALFFIAFLPQFISPTGFNITVQMLLLGFIFALQALVLFYLIALLASRLTKYVTNDRFWNITKWSKIGVLSALGLLLVFSKK